MKYLLSIILILLFALPTFAKDCKDCTRENPCVKEFKSACALTTCSYYCSKDDGGEHWYSLTCTNTLVYCPIEIPNPFEERIYPVINYDNSFEEGQEK
jgi:hypothetical protein